MTARKKYIAHLDLDCFFVSVERIRNPSLNHRPVVVGGSAGSRGVVASASYEARKFGVRSAMPTARALRLCPHLIVVHGSHAEYDKVSSKLYKRMHDFTPVVERASIDEMYLDFTGCESLYNDNLPEFMKTLQRLVWEEFSLPSTIALASNKYVAKIAAGTVKPAGVCWVPHGEEEKFLAPLPINVIPGIGGKTAALLRDNGFRIVGDIQRASKVMLRSLLGKHGSFLCEIARGKGPDVLTVEWQRKSVSREETFSNDITGIARLERALRGLVEDVCSTIRSYRWKAKTVGLKLRYSDFKTLTRAESIPPTDDDAVVLKSVVGLLKKTYKRERSVRLLGVRLTGFIGKEETEMTLFPPNGKRSRMFDAVDKLRGKFGDDVIHLIND